MNTIKTVRNIILPGKMAARYLCQKATKTLVNVSNGIKTITLNDQTKRNSLSIEMMQDLIKNITSKNNDPTLRIIVINSIGPVFSAGHNMKELNTDNKTQREVFKLGGELMKSIIESPVPVISVIKDQVAAAAGCQLIAQCDLVLCTFESSFSTPGVKYGIFCSTPGIALARKIPKASAFKMLLTGNAIKGDEAQKIGLVTEACNTNELDSRLQFYCNSILEKSREVIKLGKRFYYDQINMEIMEAYRKGGEKMVENLSLKDGKEGVLSFIEKRKPTWDK